MQIMIMCVAETGMAETILGYISVSQAAVAKTIIVSKATAMPKPTVIETAVSKPAVKSMHALLSFMLCYPAVVLRGRYAPQGIIQCPPTEKS